MPLPTRSQVHVDSALTTISVGYLQKAQNFVAGRVFPNVPVEKKSDRYFVFDRAYFNRDEAVKRAPATESAGAGFEIDNTPTYFADVWAIHHDIPDQIIANADDAINYEQAATEFVTHKMLIRREKNWTSTFFTTGVWGTDVTGVASSPSASETIQWSDDTSGDPIGDIRAAKTTILESTGFQPNTMVLNQNVMDALVDHPDIVDRVKYSGGVGNADNPAIVNEQTLAALFGLDRVMVSQAVENTANEGATASHSFIAGKNALLCYAAPSPSLLVPSGGYTFSWRGYLGTTNANGMAIKRFPMDHLESERVEASMAFDQKVVAPDVGYFWSGIVS